MSDAGGPGALSRREALAGGGRAALGASLATVGAALLRPPTAPAQPFEDDTLLAGSIGLIRTLETIYATARRSGRLEGPPARLVRVLEREEFESSELLAQQVGGGAAIPRAPDPGQIPGLADVATGRGYFELALGFESQAYLSLLDAVGALANPDSVGVAARIAAASAQHLTALRRALGEKPIAGAFELGAGG